MTRTVIEFTDSAEFGGAEQALLHLLVGLDRRRWRPILMHHVAPGLAPLLAGSHAAGVALHAVPRMPLGWRGAARVRGFARHLRHLQPAVFHAHLTWPLACKYGLAGAIAARVPAVVATAQLFVDCPYDELTRVQQRLLALGIHRYIVVSCDMGRRLAHTFGIPSRKFRVVHNGIPVPAFQQPCGPGLRAALTRGLERPIVLTNARLEAQKGHSYLLEAAVAVPGALFVFAGAGPARAALEAQAARLGLDGRVVFLGYRQDIPALLACCDLFVLPSLFEGFPLSVLEAMAAGKPVIATAISGTDEAVVPNETGILVPPANPGALAVAIRNLLANPVPAARLAAAGRAHATEHFSTTRMVQKVTAVYEEALAGRPGADSGRR